MGGLNGHGFGCSLGVGDGQGGLVCWSSWGHKELDMTEWLNWTELNIAKAKVTAPNNTEPIDTPKPTNGHCTALQREEIQLGQPEHRHKLPQPGKDHRTLTQPCPQGQTPQPRAKSSRTLIVFFFSLSLSFFLPAYEPHCLFPKHISTFILPFSGAVEFLSLFFLL